MITKPRTLPYKIFALQAILARLPEYYPYREELTKQLKNLKTGFNGEAEIDFPLSSIDIPDQFILHDLRLSDGQHYFQLDSLIVLPNVLIILEVKNISGKLHFNSDYKQVIRSLNDEEEAFPDFHLQVDRQKRGLQNWLKLHQFPAIPIDYFIVMANPRTIVTSSSTNRYNLEKVIPSVQIPSAIQSTIIKFQRSKLKKNEITLLTEKLVYHHEELKTNLLKKHKISFHDLRKGVICPSCLATPMKRENGIWRCNICLYQSRNEHKKAIKELLYIMTDGITNQMVREFLCLESALTVNRILKSMNLIEKGTNKGRRYYWNNNF